MPCIEHVALQINSIPVRFNWWEIRVVVVQESRSSEVPIERQWGLAGRKTYLKGVSRESATQPS